MARPPKFDNPEERILDAARTLIVEKGFDGVSLRAVAKKAGFSPAGLYEYFAGKADLMAALAAEANANLEGSLREALARERPGSAASLIALGMAYVAYAKTEPERFQLLFSRHISSRSSTREPVTSGSAYGVVIECVVAAVASGLLAPGDPERVSYALWSMAHGSAMLQLTTLREFEADFEANDRACFAALVRGFRIS